ncbi:MAG: PepSY domain-containing protein, partial [Clostridia bacterium]|nr:PepSY domain-containing protein [Clostridia bacterium]
NHKQRVVGEVKLSNDEAKLKVSSKINVETTRLALIPAGNKEVLAYEFTGEYKGETYYVYINAKTGAEVDIFKVVKTTEGDLLV